MLDSSLYKNTDERMKKTLESLTRDFAGIRTGRATPALLDRVTVEAYGVEMPLNQTATISVPEPRMLVIQPFDRKNISAIERGIQKAEIGIHPTNDGVVIRLVFPPLNEERRKELVKLAKKLTEDAKVAVRNIRRDMLMVLKKMDGVTEDESKKAQDEIQKRTDKNIEELGKILASKEKEIMEV